MRHSRHHKPDILFFLIIIVSFGMLFTSIAEADSQVLRMPGLTTVQNNAAGEPGYLRSNWFVLGRTSMKPAVAGSMTHVQINTREAGENAFQSHRTRLIFSLGFEEGRQFQAQTFHLNDAEIVPDYEATVFFTIRHDW